MVYLVILVVVAAAALLRLGLQQRREQTQMDTIEGFSSALEAMAPPSRPTRRERIRNASSRLRVPKPRRGSLLGWFVADRSDARATAMHRRRYARVAARRRRAAQATARRRAAAQAAARGRAAAQAPSRRRVVRNGEIRLPDARPSARSGNHGASRKIPVSAGRPSGSSRSERYAG